MLKNNFFSLKSSQTPYTLLYVEIQGFFIGLLAIVHGFYVALQGNKQTEGLFVLNSVFTIIPNYLASGILAILVAIVLMLWTIYATNNSHFSLIFLLLGVLLFLVGGGVAQVPFIIIAFLVSTRINKKLIWFTNKNSFLTSHSIADYWIYLFVLGYFFLFIGIGIWFIILPPGSTFDGSATWYILWVSLIIGAVLQAITIYSGFLKEFFKVI